MKRVGEVSIEGETTDICTSKIVFRNLKFKDVASNYHILSTFFGNSQSS